MNKNIVLIGMPGCGKSTLSKIMAKRLNKPVIDMDDYIESHEEKTIKEMFDISEAFFRDVESKYSILLGELNCHIIATGGGIVKRKENITNLKKNSVIVFINRPVDDIVGDIDVRTRPLLSKGVEAVYSLYNERIHLYKGYCDIEINNVGEIQKVADLIIEKVQLYKVENNQ
ncbi:shikimate kinase [Alkalibaculum bacchi]|jgi:shikimate kinase|uniref:shikimate kinase n=1 Tax=Alkalibaculum bacchi TaxID=645887 RepID=UPI0026EC70AC|nr:shikimate kinase [Alkalibaculum bacchi]